MLTNLLSKICICSEPKVENLTLEIQLVKNTLINEEKYLNIPQIKTSNNKLNLIHLNQNNLSQTTFSSDLNKLKIDNPIKYPFQQQKYINNSNTQSPQSLSYSSVLSKNNNEIQFLIKKHKQKKIFQSENEIFHKFQNNIDNIINMSMEKKSVSESDDS
jgi:hypothetical protein